MSNKQPLCPYLKKPCIEHECMMYTHLTMVIDPQTGASRDQWACSIALIPILLIENSNQMRFVAKAVGQAQHEITTRQDQLNNLAAGSQKISAPPGMKTIEGD